MMLSDLGAEVIKIERPGIGDQSRAWGPPFVEGESTYFMAANRGKRSVAVDFTDPRGLAVVQRLAATADVVVENFLPGAAKKLGLDRETLVGARPEVVYCSITGYPADSPNAHRPGYDFAIQGDGGIMSVTGDVDGDPMKVGVAVADITSGMYAASGILAAIIESRATGRAPAVAVSLFGSQIAWLGNRATEVLVAGIEPERFGNAHPSLVPYETFRAADGFVNLAVGSDVQYRSFCTEAGAPELADDPRYATNAGRVAGRDRARAPACRRCSRRAPWPSGSPCSTAPACRAARSARCPRWRPTRRGRSSTTSTPRPARCGRSGRPSPSTAST